jgi:hypothetical protein
VNRGAYQATASAIVVSAPDSVSAGTAFSVTVTLVDAFGKTAVGYTGTITLTSTDPAAPSLGSATLTLANAGQVTFSGVMLVTPNMWTLTASDGTLPDGTWDISVT